MRSIVSSILCVVALAMLLFSVSSFSDDGDSNKEGVVIMEAFNQLSEEERLEAEIAEQTKHIIMFVMGIVLLVAIIATAGMGLGMALYGKPLVVPHMLGAGVTVFLSLAHAVTAIVWFYPF